jgi:hypothetical protein
VTLLPAAAGEEAYACPGDRRDKAEGPPRVFSPERDETKFPNRGVDDVPMAWYVTDARKAAPPGRPRALMPHVFCAARLWPGEPMMNVVGRVFKHGDFNKPPVTVAGVVADTLPGALDREPAPEVYRPQSQRAGGAMSLVIKTAQEPGALAPAVRAEIRKMDPNLPIPTILSMREILSRTVAEPFPDGAHGDVRTGGSLPRDYRYLRYGELFRRVSNSRCCTGSVQRTPSH